MTPQIQNSAAQAAKQEIDTIMEEAQAFASAWSLIGGRFDDGNMAENAQQSKQRLFDMVSALRAPVVDEKCKRCGGPGWYTSHTTGFPESIPCSACNPQGVSVERLAKDPFLAAQLWRKPVADGSALASAPVANDVTPAGMKEICPECGHQFGCFHSPYIDKLRAQANAPVADERAAFKKCHSTIIKALAAIAMADGPDTRHEDDPELLYRSPVMDDVVRIRVALDECSAALASAPVIAEKVPLCSICNGYGRYQDGNSGREDDGYAANVVDCECDDSERRPGCRASAPVADTAAIIRDVCELDPADEGPDTISVSVTDLQRIIERHSALASVQRTACPTDVCQAGKADGVLCANDECDRANDVRSASAPAARKARPTDWQNALSITELPEVDEALATFCDDGTQDNAVGLVLVILEAAPQASAGAFAKLQSAYVGACDQIGELLAEKQTSAEDVRNARADGFIAGFICAGGDAGQAKLQAQQFEACVDASCTSQATRAKASPEDLP